MILALKTEIILRKEELQNQVVETIYFGGGTPSLLTNDEIQEIINSVYSNYHVVENPEITFEANPDDMIVERIQELAHSPVNRLSIGIQSFFEQDLKLMNRAHNVNEAKSCLQEATKYFDNISIDLIYGIPNATNQQWLDNIETALSYGVPHVSCYAMTVEPKTALESFIKKGIVQDVDDEAAQEQFHLLIDKLETEGFIHYELSNFGKPNYFSKNNTAYWQGKTYLGIGPSAHSFNGQQRGWNIRNNSKYIKALQDNQLPIEWETLTKTDRYNEYVMTGLRTIWGVSLSKVEAEFGISYKKYLLEQANKYIEQHLLYIDNNQLLVTKKGKFLSDGIASDLFKINL